MRLKVKTGIAKKDMMPYLFLMPAMFFILAFLAYPLVTVFFYSLQSYDVTKIADKGFVGLENLYQNPFDRYAQRTIKNLVSK